MITILQKLLATITTACLVVGITIIFEADTGRGWVYYNNSGDHGAFVFSGGTAYCFGSDGSAGHEPAGKIKSWLADLNPDGEIGGSLLSIIVPLTDEPEQQKLEPVPEEEYREYEY